VRERRLALGLSQVELAARAKMTQPALSRLEAGGLIPTIPLLDLIEVGDFYAQVVGDFEGDS
jgi:transcriptional regulator with XRE-family HTH domain